MAEKIAVFFPGIGYQFERPLLYYAIRQAHQFGYEILKVAYSGFPEKIRGNRERLEESVQMAESQTEEILKHTAWSSYDAVVFVSKSIGTIAAVDYAYRHHIHADQILFTPFPETFRFPIDGNTAAFHAAEDPWMDHMQLLSAAHRAGVKLHVYPKGNHSLETGDVLQDIQILQDVFDHTAKIFAGHQS